MAIYFPWLNRIWSKKQASAPAAVPNPEQIELNIAVRRLKKDINLLLPHLKWCACKLLDWHDTAEERELTLKKSTCEHSCRALGYMLRKMGYDAQPYLSEQLSVAYGNLNTFFKMDHIILVVRVPGLKTRIIVDPTYFQFLSAAKNALREYPQNEVLVMREDDVDATIRELLKFKDDGRTFNILAYFCDIWDMKRYTPLKPPKPTMPPLEEYEHRRAGSKNPEDLRAIEVVKRIRELHLTRN